MMPVLKAPQLTTMPPVSRVARRLGTHALLALLLTMNTAAAADPTVFDFRTAAGTTGWQVVNDDVMGGVSISRFVLTNGVARFSGAVSLQNNGGFASVRSLTAPQDLGRCQAFVLRVRGDGRRYKFTVRTDPSFDGPIYQAPFTTRTGEWEEHRLPLKAFVPTFRGRVLSGEPLVDPAKVTSMGFLISDQQEGPFQLEIAWIKSALASP
jgi:hypothetical protein